MRQEIIRLEILKTETRAKTYELKIQTENKTERQDERKRTGIKEELTKVSAKNSNYLFQEEKPKEVLVATGALDLWL